MWFQSVSGSQITMKSITKELIKSGRITRSGIKKEIKTEIQSTTGKVDLTTFKSEPKKKLKSSNQKLPEIAEKTAIKQEILKPKSESPKRKSPKLKREHIKIESDENPQVSPNKNSKKMPENWEIVLKNLRKMRGNFDAPVDSMGCHKCSDESATPEVSDRMSLFSISNLFFL